jgi:hypothetical protein
MRSQWLPAARTPSSIATVGVLTLMVAACGSSATNQVAHIRSTASGSTATAPTSSGAATAVGGSRPKPALAYAHCMRSHGVPKYPDPNASNETGSGLPKVGPQELGVSNSQFEVASNACSRFLPNGGHASQAVSERAQSQGISFASCMRSHGASNWPDPQATTAVERAEGAPSYMFMLDGLRGLDGRTFAPQIQTAATTCQRLTGSQIPYSG